MTYQTFFNFQRLNSYKENKTPWQLAKEKCPDIQEEALLLPPVDLDALMNKKVVCSPLRGYDVCSASSQCYKLYSILILLKYLTFLNQNSTFAQKWN
ncbi:MAG: hypothetical protein B1H08_02680 [Candidatus Omnitrophica bacterium 4484_171]|nr:MAG: hypothetical protein B1H08_02680 [Candidatus Omnitrophica bacterium 4484_171]